MTIWALSDLHLSLNTPSKDMSFFGPAWEGYMENIQSNWLACVQVSDLVLIPGDISWAMTLQEAQKDLLWIDALPGKKLILKGNHDYWWDSSAKMKKALPPSIHFIHNNTFDFENVSIGGARLWDTEEYNFSSYTLFQENPRAKSPSPSKKEEDKRLFEKELERLRTSLSQLNPTASLRIAMTHYPPIGADLAPSAASKILQEFGIHICVFGHLHSIKKHSLPFGSTEGIRYIFSSCDYLDFKPIKIR